MENYVLSGMMGLAVADALGVPVEFKERESLRKIRQLDIINKRGIIGIDGMVESKEDADLELIKAIFTGYVRQE